MINLIDVVHTNYYPYGKTLRQFVSVDEKFLTTQHERDAETGLDYRGARFYDGDVGRFLSLDPLAADYPSLSDYSYVAGNPVMFIDPTGMAPEGWIKNNESGEVSWDNEATSQANTPEGYTYASDADDNRDYTLLSGDGKLRVNDWSVFPVEDGVGQPSINLEFIPTDSKAQSGWTQTFESNLHGDSETQWSLLPNENTEERLDGTSAVQNMSNPSPSQSEYFGEPYSTDSKPSNILWDQPTRVLNEGATTNAIFKAQSSVIMNGRSVVSVLWGFEIDSQTSGTFFAPKIIENTTIFHKKAVNNLINQ